MIIWHNRSTHQLITRAVITTIAQIYLQLNHRTMTWAQLPRASVFSFADLSRPRGISSPPPWWLLQALHPVLPYVCPVPTIYSKSEYRRNFKFYGDLTQATINRESKFGTKRCRSTKNVFRTHLFCCHCQNGSIFFLHILSNTFHRCENANFFSIFVSLSITCLSFTQNWTSVENSHLWGRLANGQDHWERKCKSFFRHIFVKSG